MEGIESQEKQITPPKLPATEESNFDKLQKTYPSQKDKVQFLNDTKFSDIKEQLSKTINELAKDDTISQEDFWTNIQKVTETIFSDPLFDFDAIAKAKQAENIYLFRTELDNTKTTNEKWKEEIKNTEKEVEIENKRKELSSKYEKIDEKYKTTTNSDEFKKLKESDPNVPLIPEEKRDLYVSYLYAVNKIIDEAKKNKNTISQKNRDYIEQFNTLNNEFGIQEIDLSGLTIIEEIEPEPKDDEKESERSMDDIVYNDNLWSELVEFNADIEDFVSDKEISTINTQDIQENQDIQKTIEENSNDWYREDSENAFDQLLHKNKLDQYKDNFDEAWNIINEENIPEDDRENLKKIREKVTEYFTEKATDKIAEDTNKVIKTKAVTALIQNIGQYFNISNAAESFSIDLESGIEFNEQEMKISGSMEGKNLAFYYNMQTGEVFTDDFVHYNREEETFYINEQEDKGRWRLPIKMPTLETTLKDAKQTIIQAAPKVLESIEDINKYEEELSKTEFDIQQKSVVADIVIEHAMAKNIALQETQSFLEEYIPYSDTYSKDGDVHEYNLYTIINTSFNRYTTNELKMWREKLAIFKEKINPENQKFKDEMIKGLFSEDKREEDTNAEYDTAEGPSIYKFLDAITYDQAWTNKDYVIDLNTFWNITNQLTKEEGTTENIWGISEKYKKLRHDFQTNKEQKEADNILNETTVRLG